MGVTLGSSRTGLMLRRACCACCVRCGACWGDGMSACACKSVCMWLCVCVVLCVCMWL